MSTQPHSDLESTAPTSVSRNAMNPFGAKDLTAPAAMLSLEGLSARETPITTAPDCQPDFPEDLAEYVRAALLAIDVIIEIGKPDLIANVCLLRNPVNLDELDARIGEVLKSPKRSRLDQLITAGAKFGDDEPNPEVVAPCVSVDEDPCLNTTHPDPHTSSQFQGFILSAPPSSGTGDDHDRDDEHASDNETPVRAVDEGTEHVWVNTT